MGIKLRAFYLYQSVRSKNRALKKQVAVDDWDNMSSLSSRPATVGDKLRLETQGDKDATQSPGLPLTLSLTVTMHAMMQARGGNASDAFLPAQVMFRSVSHKQEGQ